MAVYNEVITENITAEFNLQVKSRTNLAKRYFLSAQQFRDKCRVVETEHLGKPFDNFLMEIETQVVGTIFFSVAALEANVNELFHDTEQLHAKCNSTICQKKFNEVKLKNFLERYKALASLDTKIIPNNLAYNDAAILQKLRNGLMHFYPEFDDEKEAHLDLGKSLEGKFKSNPFFNPTASFFPEKYMSYGCAEWALKTAQQFITNFSKIINMPNILD